MRPSWRAPRAATGGEDAERIAGTLRPGKTVVIYGERVGHGPDGERALAALIACADALNLSADGAGLLEVPETCNARGLREVGCLPTAGPGLSETAQGMSATQVRDALEAEELDALILWDVDPIRELPDPERWRTALGAADFVLEVGMFGNASGGQADVFLPGESHAEKEGTVTHPDGRVQRVRPSVPHPGDTRHGWQWLAELAFRLGHETGIDSSTEALEALAAEVPFYAGLTHEEIGGTGVRWQEREAAHRPSRDRGEGPRVLPRNEKRRAQQHRGDRPRPTRGEWSGGTRGPLAGTARNPPPRHLPRPLGLRGDRALARAALPHAGADARALARRRRALRRRSGRPGERALERPLGQGEGRHPRAHPPRLGLPDRGARRAGPERRSLARRRSRSRRRGE